MTTLGTAPTLEYSKTVRTRSELALSSRYGFAILKIGGKQSVK